MRESLGLPLDFGFEGEGVSFSEAKLALFFAAKGDDKTLGRAPGPAAVADASRYVEFFEMRGGLHALDVGIYAELCGSSAPETLASDRFTRALAKGVFPLVIAENRFAMPMECGPTVALWGKIGRAECEETVLGPDRDALLVGVRAASERAYKTARDRVTMVTSEQLQSTFSRLDKITRGLESPVHLSIDFDVFAPNVVDLERVVEPGGLAWYDFVHVLEKLFDRPGVKSAELVGAEGVRAKTRAALIGAQILTKIAALLQRGQPS